MSFHRQDLERILGWHDGSGIHIVSDALDSPAVMTHEAVHGRLFNETPDGSLHRACCLAAGSKYDAAHGGAYTQVGRFLFDDTRLAHEAAATYLGIQGLPSADARAREYGKLPSDYRDYYAVLAELIDPVSKTSWLKYAFAWAFCHWCFHSRRSMVFFEQERPNPSLVLEIESPSTRMIKASAALRGKRLFEWRDAAVGGAVSMCRAKGVEPWDVEDEEAWDERAGGDAALMLDNYLTHKSGHWLLDNMNFETDDYRVRKPVAIGFSKLMEGLNHHWVDQYRGPDTELNPDERGKVLEHHAKARGADSIKHMPTGLVEILSEESDDRLMEVTAKALETASDLFFLSEAGPSDQRLFMLFRSRRRKTAADADPYQYQEVGSYLVAAPLAIRMAQVLLAAKTSGEFDGLRLWVMLSASMETVQEVVLRCARLTCDLRDLESDTPVLTPIIPREQVALYLHDNWTRLHGMPTASVSSAEVELADTDQPGETKRLSIRVARIEQSLFGYFLSAKTAWAGLRIEDYEQYLIATGALKGFTLPDGSQDLSEVIAPLIAAWHYWDRF